MTPPGPNSRAELFRKAVEADDFSAAEAALQNYLTWFRSAPRTPVEVAQAKSLCEWGVQVATARKSGLAGKLSRLTTVFAGYRPSRPSIHTWNIDA
jgi:hypothetical protein